MTQIDPLMNSGRMLKNLIILTFLFFVMLLVSSFLAIGAGEIFVAGSRECYLAQSAVQAIVAFCGAAIATAYFTARRPWHFLGLANGCGWRPLVGVIVVFIVGLPFINQLIYYNSLLTLPASLAPLEQAMKSMEEQAAQISTVILNTRSVGGLISGILIIGVLTALGEEMLFRGTLQRILNQLPAVGVWSVWISAFIFSAVHLQFYGFLPRLLLGAFFGFMLYRTGSLWPGVFAHALNNSIVVVSAWLTERGVLGEMADDLGVVKDGFPVWGALSAVALVLIFTVFSRTLFPSMKRNG